jgi:hypothetical protein
LSQTINQFANQMASPTNHIHITPAPVTKHMHKMQSRNISCPNSECNVRWRTRKQCKQASILTRHRKHSADGHLGYA